MQLAPQWRAINLVKKILNKVLRKKKTEESQSTRITTNTVAEHRERILAGGRRFKYPVQYARHKLVFNTIIISIAAILIFGLIGWQQLYVAQNTSNFMYRVTTVIPVSVASVDGQAVRYSNYLRMYRSAAHYLENKEQVDLESEDGRRQTDYIKRQSMDEVVADAYAVKLADEMDISVSQEEIDSVLLEQRQTEEGEISAQTHDAVILDYYGWSTQEYRDTIKNKLLRQKVAYEVDEKASELVESIRGRIDSGTNLEKLSGADRYEGEPVSSGGSGWVPRSNQDSGLAKAAIALEKKGAVSESFKPSNGDGYYFIKLVDINDTQVKYEYIKVELTEFDSSLESAHKEYHIDVPKEEVNEERG